MTDPLRDLPHQQPGIATYPPGPGYQPPTGRDPGETGWRAALTDVRLTDRALCGIPWTPPQPAVRHADARTSPAGGNPTPETAQTIVADHPSSQAPGTVETAAEQGKPDGPTATQPWWRRLLDRITRTDRKD